jgi:hypothetical protein
MEICQRKNSSAISNPDSVLRDHFVENVRDKMLRRELKQFIRLNPGSSFLNVRREAFRWADDGEGARPVRARAFSCDASAGMVGEWGAQTQAVAAKSNDELAELQDCLRRQQTQLDTILKHLSSGPVPFNSNSRPSKPAMPFNSNSRPGNPPQRYKFAADGRPICLRCDQAGHMARDCLTVQRQGPHVRNDFGQRTVNTGDVQSSGLPGN